MLKILCQIPYKTLPFFAEYKFQILPNPLPSVNVFQKISFPCPKCSFKYRPNVLKASCLSVCSFAALMIKDLFCRRPNSKWLYIPSSIPLFAQFPICADVPFWCLVLFCVVMCSSCRDLLMHGIGSWKFVLPVSFYAVIVVGRLALVLLWDMSAR